MAELFQVTPQNVTLHLKTIYEEGELNETATCKDYLQVRSEGGRRVSRETAEEKAEREYERFSERRRAEIGSQAEQDTIRELEETARKLPNPAKKPGKKRQGDES